MHIVKPPHQPDDTGDDPPGFQHIGVEIRRIPLLYSLLDIARIHRGQYKLTDRATLDDIRTVSGRLTEDDIKEGGVDRDVDGGRS